MKTSILSVWMQKKKDGLTQPITSKCFNAKNKKTKQKQTQTNKGHLQLPAVTHIQILTFLCTCIFQSLSQHTHTDSHSHLAISDPVGTSVPCTHTYLK